MKTATRLARCVPTGGAPRRVYVPGGALFAMRPLKFQGAEYRKGDPLPVAKMSKARHFSLWTSGNASHEPRGPFDKRKSVVGHADSFAKAAEQPAGTAFDVSDAANEVASERVALAVTPGEVVNVRTPEQVERGRGRRR